MHKIIWSDALSVGVHELDTQHQQIIALINEWMDCGHEDFTPEVFQELLSQAMDTLIKHLIFEESLLLEHGYPDIAAHSAVHGQHITKVSDLSLQVVNGDISPCEIVKYLRNWWIQHIRNEDMQYRSFLAAKGVT